VRIAILGKNKLKLEGEEEKKEVRHEEKGPFGLTPSILENLFLLMNISPSDTKAIMDKKLNSLRNENVKVVPPKQRKAAVGKITF
jgi:hypothetical protein